MSDSLANLILSLTPEDGSSIGNGAMLALLREHIPTPKDEGNSILRQFW
jgi:adenine-specific DNA-methyltransferase